MSPIKDFWLDYDAVNEGRIFSEGDTISGRVTFTLTKDTKVKGLMVKAKGDASVHWTEGSGDDERSYSAHRRYFKLKQYLIPENAKNIVLPKGVHRFKFMFKIPEGNMPSSFRGVHGVIVYVLEAKLSRSWRWPTGVKEELNFVSKSLLHLGQVMCPQSGSVGKKMGVFSKGQVQMSATVSRKVCSPGDTISVAAKICNSSSKKMKPKFRLEQKIVYRASGSTNTSEKYLCKMVGNSISPNSEEAVSCHVQIPADVIPTVHNCDIISVDYILKVYLDISFAFDPEVVFPLVIVPSSCATFPPGEAVGPHPAVAAGAPSFSDFPPPAVSMGPYPPGAVGAPSYSNFPPPAVLTGSHPVPAGSGAYGHPAPVPTQHGNITSGYNNQCPQQAAPYSFPTAASSVRHQAPTAPPLFQEEEEPPSYMSLFAPAEDPLGRTGSDYTGLKNTHK